MLSHVELLYTQHFFLAGVTHIDLERREVVVRAGTLLRDLNSVLWENGLVLSTLPTLVDQTIGGALAVGE